MHKEILRQCYVTKEMCDRSKLIRIVKNKEGQFAIDESSKLPGRGAYISKNREVIEKCVKKQMLNKAFSMQVPKEIYEELLSKIDE